jgi:propanol-preferring alcohol dehydrogenase
VIGVGGLGHLAVQVLRALAPVRVVAVDTSERARDLAEDVGADLVLDPARDDVAEIVRGLTGGAGADVVLDFVAGAATLPVAAAALARGGELAVVGVGAATLPVSVPTVPLGATVRIPYWGTRGDLRAVLDLARTGRLVVHTTPFELEAVHEAWDLMASGGLVGRAVVDLGGSA